VIQREPEGNGLIFRALEIPPALRPDETYRDLPEAARRGEPKACAIGEDIERHPSLHRTDTLDMFTITRGEIYLVTDTDEVLLKSGDSAIVQGVNHAWSIVRTNRA